MRKIRIEYEADGEQWHERGGELRLARRCTEHQGCTVVAGMHMTIPRNTEVIVTYSWLE